MSLFNEILILHEKIRDWLSKRIRSPLHENYELNLRTINIYKKTFATYYIFLIWVPLGWTYIDRRITICSISRKCRQEFHEGKYQKLMKCIIRVTCNKKTEKFKHCMDTLQRAFDRVADSWRMKSLEFLRSPPYYSILGSCCVNQLFFSLNEMALYHPGILT